MSVLHRIGIRKMFASPVVTFLRVLMPIERLRETAILMICRLEGGQFWSPTFRSLMKKYYGVQIGRYSYGGCLLPGDLPQGVWIGNFCSLASGIRVLRRNHPHEFVSMHPFFYEARLGVVKEDSIPPGEQNPLDIMHDAWIGVNAVITARCRRIGIGAAVGAGSVVTSDVDDFSVVAGNPARAIRKRFKDEICQELLESRWWEYSLEQLHPVLHLFLGDCTVEKAKQLRDYLRSVCPD